MADTNLNPAPVISGPSTAKTSPAPGPWMCGMLRGTRNDLLAKIAASGLSDAQKALVSEEIGKVPPQFDLLRLDFHRHSFNSGSNTTFTLTEL